MSRSGMAYAPRLGVTCALTIQVRAYSAIFEHNFTLHGDCFRNQETGAASLCEGRPAPSDYDILRLTDGVVSTTEPRTENETTPSCLMKLLAPPEPDTNRSLMSFKTVGYRFCIAVVGSGTP